MEILSRSTTPDGIKLNLEEWPDGYLIGAYPIAKNGNGWIEPNHTFRLTLTPRNGEDMFAVFEVLKSGDITIENLSSMFWNGDKDKYYLGIETEEDKANLTRQSAEDCLVSKLSKRSFVNYGLSQQKADEIWFAASNRAAEEAQSWRMRALITKKPLCSVT